MPETIYFTLEEVIELHDEILERMGYPYSPLLHPDKLDAALHRPRWLAHYQPGTDLIAQAVILAIGISQAQAFQEGNKRTALAVADTFLAANGVRVDGDPIEFACWLICVAGEISSDELDVVTETFGLDFAANLKAMERDSIIECFEAWLRSNVSYHDPNELMGEEK